MTHEEHEVFDSRPIDTATDERLIISPSVSDR